ncbi:MAG: AIPR family protein [Terracidiphilus sp.]
MTDQEFLKFLKAQVSTLRSKYKITEGKAFAMWFCMENLQLDETEAYEAASLDGGNDKDIDLFWVDDEAERITIAQFKFASGGKYKGKKGELLALIHSTDWLVDTEALRREGRPELANAAVQYSEAQQNSYSTEYIYAYCGPQHKDVNDVARQFNVREASGTPARSCKIYNLDSLKKIHEEQIDQSTRISKTTLNLLRCFEEPGDYGKAVVATIKGDVLRSLYVDFGDRLFDRNVRLFLGARKGGVNAGIQDTLGDADERKRFWAYNNGVTFVCDDYDLDDTQISLTNFSIVNGCQTTVSLWNGSETAAKDVKVGVRFIASPERIIDSIILFNNSQNPVRLWDLNAQDRLQKRLKKELAELPQPFLYQLRRGETIDVKAKKKFLRDGRLNLIRHDLCAQFGAAFRGFPAIGYKDKGKVFTTHKDQVFPSQIRPEEIVLIWQAGRVAGELVKKELAAAAQGGDIERAAILKRGGTFFVLATMGYILHQRNGATFLNKLRPDVAVSKTTEQRLQNYAALSLEFYTEAMRDLLNLGSGVAELVRSQTGWQKILPKIESRWKIYRLSKKVMESALPAL